MQVSALTALAKTSGRAAARDVAAEATVVQGFLFFNIYYNKTFLPLYWDYVVASGRVCAAVFTSGLYTHKYTCQH